MAGSPEDDAVRLLDERLESDPAQRSPQRTAAGHTAHSEERLHDPVRRHRRCERGGDRELRRAWDSALVPLTRVVFGKELVET